MAKRPIPDTLKTTTAEMIFVGSLYEEPEDYIKYGPFMRPKYDFCDDGVKFFYNHFEIIYKRLGDSFNRDKVKAYFYANEGLMKDYNKFGGYSTIDTWNGLGGSGDMDKLFKTIKKYSLLREYFRRGFPVQKIMKLPNFEDMEANDIYKSIRSMTDKINTIISADTESVDILKGNEALVDSYLERPDMGLRFPWPLVNRMSRGMREGQLFLCGFLSNAGKTRNLMYLAAYVTIVHHKRFLLLSNEMAEKDIRNCLITTVANNKPFQKLHGIEIHKPEREIVLGQYRDENGNFMKRKTDDDGNFIETVQEFKGRLKKDSEEYRKIKEISHWMDNAINGNLYFKDMGSDYSDQAIEFEVKKHKALYDVHYVGYDTLKGYGDPGDWAILKQTATKLKELAKEAQVFLWADLQLTDDAVFVPVDELTSNNIANCKGMKHVCDFLILGKEIDQEQYEKYQMRTLEHWGSSKDKPMYEPLNLSKRYFGFKIDKNRAGDKNHIPLIELDLDINQWREIGEVVRKKY